MNTHLNIPVFRRIAPFLAALVMQFFSILERFDIIVWSIAGLVGEKAGQLGIQYALRRPDLLGSRIEQPSE